MKKTDIPDAKNLLLEVENDYVSACARFITRDDKNDSVWLLKEKKGGISAIVINSRSTVIPVFCRNQDNKGGLKNLPDSNTLKTFLRKKKIHSVQGLKKEVIILEEILKETGKKAVDIFDYDLMSLNAGKGSGNGEWGMGNKTVSNLVLRVPGMTDLDALAPLQAAYEKEEVLPKGSVFSPAASRLNLAQIIAGGRILAAELNGQMVGKINVSAVSFTRFQVGGVFVRPEFRGLGIGEQMAKAFISKLIDEGRGITLFVKENNIAARKLYTKLGFTAVNDYRITYY